MPRKTKTPKRRPDDTPPAGAVADPLWSPQGVDDRKQLYWRNPHFDPYMHLARADEQVTWHQGGSFSKRRLQGDELAAWLPVRQEMLEALLGERVAEGLTSPEDAEAILAGSKPTEQPPPVALNRAQRRAFARSQGRG